MDRYELARLIDNVIKENHDELNQYVIEDALNIELSLYKTE